MNEEIPKRAQVARYKSLASIRSFLLIEYEGLDWGVSLHSTDFRSRDVSHGNDLSSRTLNLKSPAIARYCCSARPQHHGGLQQVECYGAASIDGGLEASDAHCEEGEESRDVVHYPREF